MYPKRLPLVSGSCLLLTLLPVYSHKLWNTYWHFISASGLSKFIRSCLQDVLHEPPLPHSWGKGLINQLTLWPKQGLGPQGREARPNTWPYCSDLVINWNLNWPMLSSTVHPGMLPLSPENATWNNDVIGFLFLGSFSFSPLCSSSNSPSFGCVKHPLAF